jgi:hypothetical protein
MTRSFETVGGSAINPFDIQTGAEPVQGIAAMASGALFETLGVRAALGRTLARADDRPGGDRVVVLGHSLWQRLWGGDRAIVGKSILLGGAKWTVVGVMGPEFALPEQRSDLYVPLWLGYPAAAPERGVHFLPPRLSDLKPGVTVSAARADLDAAFRELGRRYPRDGTRGSRPVSSASSTSVVGDSRRSLAILAAAVGLVLLIACANLANLQMTNVLAPRAGALDPRRARRIAPQDPRQILTESAVLALLGGGLGFLLSAWGTEALLSRFPEALPRLSNVGSNLRVAAFTFAASLLTSVVFASSPRGRLRAPLRLAARLDALAGLRDSRSARGTLVVAEIALALVLLVGAGSCCACSGGSRASSRAFRVDGLVAARIDLPASRYEKTETQSAFRRRLLESLYGRARRARGARQRAADVGEPRSTTTS